MADPIAFLDPSGTTRMVPAEQADAAEQAGGKRAVKMLDPSGTARWVSLDQKDAALKAGGKLADDAPNSVIGGMVRRGADTLKGVGALVSPPQTKTEQAVSTFGGPAVLPLYRMGKGAVDSGIEAGKQAADQFREARAIAPGNKEIKGLSYLRSAVTALSALNPLASGSVTNVNRLEDQGRSREAAGQALTDIGLLVAPKVAGKVAEAVTPESLRTAAQRVVVGKQPVRQMVKAAVEKSAADSEDVAANNSALEEQRGRRREIETRTGQKTAALSAKQQAIQTAATADNATRWNKLRDANGDDVTTSAEPVKIAMRAASDVAEPVTSPLFQRILKPKHTPGEKPVAGFIREPGPRATPREWEEFQARQDARPDPDVEPPSMDPDNLTFSQIQRWRTYLNHRRYGPGQLDGNTIHAYDLALKGLDAAQQDITDQTGTTADLHAARASHAKLMTTFSDSPNIKMTAAKQNLQRTNPEAFREQHDQEMEGRVAQYDPSYAKDAADVRSDRAKLKSFPSEEEMKNSLKPPPDVPVIGPDEIRAAKQKGVDAKIGMLHHRGEQLASLAGTYGVLRGILHGSVSEVGESVLLAGGSLLTLDKIAETLTRPGVQEWLTRPEPADLEQIQRLPPEMRADVARSLKPLVEAAVKKGLKVAPAIVSAAGAMVPKTPGEAKQRVAAAKPKNEASGRQP